MRRLLLTLTVLLFCCGAAQARFYIGFPATSILTGEGIVPLGGLTIGTYNLYPHFGVRASAQTSLLSLGVSGFVEGSVDGTYSFGEGVIFYTGAGLGYSSYLGDGAVTLAGFTGLDFDAGSVISLFLEIRPILYIGSMGAVQIRSGLNFHIGEAGGERETGECCVIP